MNIDLKSIVFGAFLGGVFVAAVLSFVAPKSGVGRFEIVSGGEVFDTQTGEHWILLNKGWTLRGASWNQRR